MLDYTKYRVELMFTDTVLGSQPTREVVTDWIYPQVPDDEAAALPEKLEKATTVFHKVNDSPVFFNYQIKGFLKAAAQVINGLKVFEGRVRALKSKVSDHVFVEPRVVPMILPPDAEITMLERPLRAETAQGPRTALARSEEVPAGTRIIFTIRVLTGSPIEKDILETLLCYGEYVGLGQWRNAGHGSFMFRWLDEPVVPA